MPVFDIMPGEVAKCVARCAWTWLESGMAALPRTELRSSQLFRIADCVRLYSSAVTLSTPHLRPCFSG